MKNIAKLCLVNLLMLTLTACDTDKQSQSEDKTDKRGISLSERVDALANNVENMPYFTNETNEKENKKALKAKKAANDNRLDGYQDYSSFVNDIDRTAYSFSDNEFIKANSVIGSFKALKAEYLPKITQYGVYVYQFNQKEKVKVDYISETDTLEFDLLSSYDGSASQTHFSSTYDDKGRIFINGYSISSDFVSSIYYLEGEKMLYVYQIMDSLLDESKNTITIVEQDYEEGEEKRVVAYATPTKFSYFSFFDSDNFDYAVEAETAYYGGIANPYNCHVKAYDKSTGGQMADFTTRLDGGSTSEMIVLATSMFNEDIKAYFKYDSNEDKEFVLNINDKVYGYSNTEFDFMKFGYDGLYPSRLSLGIDKDNKNLSAPAISFAYDTDLYGKDYEGVNISNIFDGILEGANLYGLTFRNDYREEISDVTSNIKGSLHDLSLDTLDHLDEMSVDAAYQIFNKHAPNRKTAEELLSLYDSAKAIEEEEQIENNDRVINIKADIKIEGSFDIANKKITLSKKDSTLSKSQLLIEGNEYSLVIGLKGKTSFIELGRNTLTFNNEDLSFLVDDDLPLLSNDMFLEADSYKLVAYVIETSNEKEYKITDDFSVKIGNFETISEETYREFNEEVIVYQNVDGVNKKITYSVDVKETTTYTYECDDDNLLVTKDINQERESKIKKTENV